MIYQKKAGLRSFVTSIVRLIMLRLRMSGTIPLLHLYAFIAWTGVALLFTVVKHD
jgi:hypothetical protein